MADHSSYAAPRTHGSASRNHGPLGMAQQLSLFLNRSAAPMRRECPSRASLRRPLSVNARNVGNPEAAKDTTAPSAWDTGLRLSARSGQATRGGRRRANCRSAGYGNESARLGFVSLWLSPAGESRGASTRARTGEGVCPTPSISPSGLTRKSTLLCMPPIGGCAMSISSWQTHMRSDCAKWHARNCGQAHSSSTPPRSRLRHSSRSASSIAWSRRLKHGVSSTGQSRSNVGPRSFTSSSVSKPTATIRLALTRTPGSGR